MDKKIHMKNTKRGYGLVAICLHWIVAAVFVINYALVYSREWFFEPQNEFARTLISTHTALGVSVLVFVIIRVVWRLANIQPADVPGSKLEHVAAHAAHILLYAAMIIMPLTGYLGTGGPSKLFFVFEIPSFRDTWVFQTIMTGWFGLEWDAFEGVMDFIHKKGGAYVISILIAAHASAALFHHLVRRDDVLRRMVSPRN